MSANVVKGKNASELIRQNKRGVPAGFKPPSWIR